jgi:hypothetical protein
MPPMNSVPRLGSLSVTSGVAEGGTVASVMRPICSAVRVKRWMRCAIGRSLDSTRCTLSGARAAQAAAGQERA